MRFSRLLAAAFVLVLLAPALPASGQSGYVVTFPRPGTNDTLVRYNDTLFVGTAPVTSATFDANGDVWYASFGGVVHERVGTSTRELFTRADGLPESVALDLASAHGKVYVATDLGLAIIDVATGHVTNKTPENSPLPTPALNSVLTVGDQVWLATGCVFEGCVNAGIVVWNTTTDTWATKNTSTTAFRPATVLRLERAAGAVWAATDGDGAWRFDLAKSDINDATAWSSITSSDGLFTDRLISATQLGDQVFLGTRFGIARYDPNEKGTPAEWRRYNATHDGMPDNRASNMHVVPTTDGKAALLVDTPQGVWELDPVTGANATLAQNFGILGADVNDDHWDPTWGWLFATQRGVSMQRNGLWTYFTPGPSTGASNTPRSTLLTSLGVGDSGSFLWFGSKDAGISGYRLPKPGVPGKFYSFGAPEKFPSLCSLGTSRGPCPVNWIDSEGPMTWFATDGGVWGLDTVNLTWRLTPTAGKLTYGVDADGTQLWLPTFGNGLVMVDLATKATRTWNKTTTPTFPDDRLTDARVTPTDVWLGASSGLIRLDRATGAVLHAYARADGLPGDGVVYRVLPDGPSVYVGMRNGGVAQLDVATGRINHVWNATTTPGFPAAQVDALYRNGHDLWVGTHAGLVRIDLVTNTASELDVSNGLVQDFVTGIGLADGILYLSTYSGIARYDVVHGAFLPMQDAPGIVRVGPGATGTAHGSASAAGALTVRFEAPRDGAAVTGLVQLRGSALKLGGSIDKVEVRIGDGPWTRADGAESWAFEWNTSGGPLNSPVPVFARAVSGNDTSPEAELLLTPVAQPTIALSLAPTMPDTWTAGRDLPVTLRATGDEPLSARIYYEPEGQTTYTPLTLTRSGGFFVGTIPGRDVLGGNLTYYFEIRSGLLAMTSPEDSDQPARLPIGPAPSLGVALTAPANVVAEAGIVTPIPVTVRNTGTLPVTIGVSASGLRSSWARVPGGESITLAGGQSRTLNVTLDVPAAAFAANTSLTFEARDLAGIAAPAKVDVPVEVRASAAAPPTNGSAGKPTPGPALPLALAAVAVALLLRRRSA